MEDDEKEPDKKNAEKRKMEPVCGYLRGEPRASQAHKREQLDAKMLQKSKKKPLPPAVPEGEEVPRPHLFFLICPEIFMRILFFLLDKLLDDEYSQQLPVQMVAWGSNSAAWHVRLVALKRLVRDTLLASLEMEPTKCMSKGKETPELVQIIKDDECIKFIFLDDYGNTIASTPKVTLARLLFALQHCEEGDSDYGDNVLADVYCRSPENEEHEIRITVPIVMRVYPWSEAISPNKGNPESFVVAATGKVYAKHAEKKVVAVLDKDWFLRYLEYHRMMYMASVHLKSLKVDLPEAFNPKNWCSRDRKTFDVDGCCAIILWLLTNERVPEYRLVCKPFCDGLLPEYRLVCKPFCDALDTLVRRGCDQEDNLKFSIPKDVPIRLKMCVLGGRMFFNCRRGLFVFDVRELPTLIPSSEKFAKLARKKYQLDLQIYNKILQRDGYRKEQGKAFKFQYDDSSDDSETSPVSPTSDPALSPSLCSVHRDAAAREKDANEEIKELQAKREDVQSQMSNCNTETIEYFFDPDVSLKIEVVDYEPGNKQAYSRNFDRVARRVYFCLEGVEYKVFDLDSWDMEDLKKFRILHPKIMSFVWGLKRAGLLFHKLKERCRKGIENKVHSNWVNLVHKLS